MTSLDFPIFSFLTFMFIVKSLQKEREERFFLKCNIHIFPSSFLLHFVFSFFAIHILSMWVVLKFYDKRWFLFHSTKHIFKNNYDTFRKFAYYKNRYWYYISMKIYLTVSKEQTFIYQWNVKFSKSRTCSIKMKL